MSSLIQSFLKLRTIEKLLVLAFVVQLVVVYFMIGGHSAGNRGFLREIFGSPIGILLIGN